MELLTIGDSHLQVAFAFVVRRLIGCDDFSPVSDRHQISRLVCFAPGQSF